jgi:lipopolysaccharide transport system ATP-binding protein
MSLPPDVSLRATNVCKMFKIYSKPSDLLRELISPSQQRYTEFWALRDVSFELKRGEVVGIIGSNGAGKSTLLKLITKNLDLTGGSIETNGQVVAILELGSGFNPEYTGRENIYNGGIVAGMTRAEIDSKVEDIIEFSGIREFIDRPFKTYSSGMQARLTFSLAVSRRAEILILDEALAAGDAIFANKCLKRIKEICESDTTVLFVSHSTDMVRRFCHRAIWLENGRVVLQGDTNTVTKAYDRFVYEQSEKYLQSQSISATELASISDFKGEISSEFFKYGSKEVKITGLRTVDADGMPTQLFHTGDYLEIQISHEGSLENPLEICHVGCQVINAQGIYAFTASSRYDCENNFQIGKQGVFKIVLSPLLLGSGDYFLSPALYAKQPDDELRWLDFHDRLYKISVRSKKHPHANTILEHPLTWHYEAFKS